MNVSEFHWRSHPSRTSLVLLLGDPHQLDGDPRCWSGTSRSWAWSSLGNPLHQSLRFIFIWVNVLLKLVIALELVVLWWKVILSVCSLGKSMFILLPLRNKLGLGVLTFFPFNSISVEVANAMVLLVSSVLAYNLLKLLTPNKTLVDTFLYNSFQ